MDLQNFTFAPLRNRPLITIAIIISAAFFLHFESITRNLGMIFLNHALVTTANSKDSGPSWIQAIRFLHISAENSESDSWGAVIASSHMDQKSNMAYDPQALLTLSKKSLAAGTYKSGLAYAQQVVQDHPDLRDGYYYKGMHALFLNSLNEASTSFEQGVSATNYTGEIGLSDLYFQWGVALAKDELSNSDFGREQFLLAFELDHFRAGNINQTKFELAESLRSLNERESSIMLLQSIVTQEPRHFRARVTLGFMLLNTHPEDSAILFQEAINISPLSTTPKLGLAQALELVSEVEEAIELYEQVIEIDASNQEAQNALVRLKNNE